MSHGQCSPGIVRVAEKAASIGVIDRLARLARHFILHTCLRKKLHNFVLMVYLDRDSHDRSRPVSNMYLDIFGTLEDVLSFESHDTFPEKEARVATVPSGLKDLVKLCLHSDSFVAPVDVQPLWGKKFQFFSNGNIEVSAYPAV